ncbi:MAG TPA: hypothetical protein PLC99_24525 [Verrucomicrobiota bacterium]|nr:hypothetical protein [Verrucomicrobiota bacterium]
MPDIAMGRKEIMKVLHVSSWLTILNWKKKSPGFRKIFRRNLVNGRPFIIISEARAWMIEMDNIKKQQEQS